ncbi:hypothetical protein GCM10025857_61320 [Alicyclobacillus contaminans]|uniref:Uncharacterized protein n=1 Tax=Tetragenococcus osmophilus TaxID=526944 RepID=A0AA37XJZ2_9ENTE|nr:hypothetical protein GCM10025857_61320 [Alicyclobacillus contaminans]GMA71416.1 hypothetical protein GCM10025885_04650 [Tetragenococcus osmophilus]
MKFTWRFLYVSQVANFIIKSSGPDNLEKWESNIITKPTFSNESEIKLFIAQIIDLDPLTVWV